MYSLLNTLGMLMLINLGLLACNQTESSSSHHPGESQLPSTSQHQELEVKNKLQEASKAEKLPDTLPTPPADSTEALPNKQEIGPIVREQPTPATDVASQQKDEGPISKLKAEIFALNESVKEAIQALANDPEVIGNHDGCGSINMEEDIIKPLSSASLSELEERYAQIKNVNLILAAKVEEAMAAHKPPQAILLTTDHDMTLWEAKILLKLEKIVYSKIEAKRKEQELGIL